MRMSVKSVGREDGGTDHASVWRFASGGYSGDGAGAVTLTWKSVGKESTSVIPAGRLLTVAFFW